jgi:uncharacterized protein YaiL (DUF2058 family)
MDGIMIISEKSTSTPCSLGRNCWALPKATDRAALHEQLLSGPGSTQYSKKKKERKKKGKKDKAME